MPLLNQIYHTDRHSNVQPASLTVTSHLKHEVLAYLQVCPTISVSVTVEPLWHASHHLSNRKLPQPSFLNSLFWAVGMSAIGEIPNALPSWLSKICKILKLLSRTVSVFKLGPTATTSWGRSPADVPWRASVFLGAVMRSDTFTLCFLTWSTANVYAKQRQILFRGRTAAYQTAAKNCGYFEILQQEAVVRKFKLAIIKKKYQCWAQQDA